MISDSSSLYRFKSKNHRIILNSLKRTTKPVEMIYSLLSRKNKQMCDGVNQSLRRTFNAWTDLVRRFQYHKSYLTTVYFADNRFELKIRNHCWTIHWIQLAKLNAYWMFDLVNWAIKPIKLRINSLGSFHSTYAMPYENLKIKKKKKTNKIYTDRVHTFNTHTLTPKTIGYKSLIVGCALRLRNARCVC